EPAVGERVHELSARIARDAERHRILLQPGAELRLVRVDADGEHVQTFSVVAIVELGERGHPLLARSAPARPEGHDGRPTRELLALECTAIEEWHLEARDGLADIVPGLDGRRLGIGRARAATEPGRSVLRF